MNTSLFTRQFDPIRETNRQDLLSFFNYLDADECYHVLQPSTCSFYVESFLKKTDFYGY